MTRDDNQRKMDVRDGPDGAAMFNALSGEIADVMQTFSEIAKETQAHYSQVFPEALKRLDEAIYCLTGVFMPALDWWGRQNCEVIWCESEAKRASPSFVFVGLLASVINSALATRHLISTGFDRQARAVFRELTEVGDLLLIIVGDEKFLDLYLDSPEDFDQAREYWDKNLKPWRVRQRVKDVARQAGFDGIWPNSEALWTARWALYAWLSKSAHVDYAALVVESVAADPNGLYNINIGGRVGNHSESTLQNINEYLHDLLILLALFLSVRHLWSRDKPDLHESLLVIRAFAEASGTIGEQGSAKPSA